MQMKATWGTLRVSENTIPPMTGDLEGNVCNLRRFRLIDYKTC